MYMNIFFLCNMKTYLRAVYVLVNKARPGLYKKNSKKSQKSLALDYVFAITKHATFFEVLFSFLYEGVI